jgi:hypothetical protein
VDDYKWELYHIAEDFSQAVNLADREPAKLRELQDLFWIEAAKYDVLPRDNSTVSSASTSASVRASRAAATCSMPIDTDQFTLASAHVTCDNSRAGGGVPHVATFAKAGRTPAVRSR